MSYNGWTNYPTWNVNLWLDNDQGTQAELRRIAQDNKGRDTYYLSRSIREFVEEILPATTGMACDLLRYALDEVDWREIAEHWEADRDENEEEESEDE